MHIHILAAVPGAVIRPLVEADFDAVLALRPRVYPTSGEIASTEPDAAVYRWLERNPAGPMRRWVIDDGGQIVGHLAAVPLRYRIGEQVIVAATPTDYMALPGYGFAAVALMRAFFAAYPDYLACNVVGDVSRIEHSFGAVTVTELSHAVRFLDVAHWPRRPRRVPGLIASMAGGALRGLDRLLLAGNRRLRVEQVAEFGPEFDQLYERVAPAVLCTLEKSAAYLTWRYGPDTPRPPSAVLVVREGDALAGYAVLRASDRADGFVLDLTTLPQRRDVARALLAEAVRRFWRERVYALRYRFVPSPVTASARDLARLGFLVRSHAHPRLARVAPERYLELLVKLADPGRQALAVSAGAWAYNQGDGEASFWVH